MVKARTMSTVLRASYNDTSVWQNRNEEFLPAVENRITVFLTTNLLQGRVWDELRRNGSGTETSHRRKRGGNAENAMIYQYGE